MTNWIWIFLGGGCGSLCRYAISLWVGNPGTKFPFATLCANILSCIILALTFNYFSEKLTISEAVKSFIVIGFCGGFSTFSTFSRESVMLIQNGYWVHALAYIFISVMICVGLIWMIEKV